MVEYLAIFQQWIVPLSLLQRLTWVDTLKAAFISVFSLVLQSHSCLEVPPRFADVHILLVLFKWSFDRALIFGWMHHSQSIRDKTSLNRFVELRIDVEAWRVVDLQQQRLQLIS